MYITIWLFHAPHLWPATREAGFHKTEADALEEIAAGWPFGTLETVIHMTDAGPVELDHCEDGDVGYFVPRVRQAA